MRSFAYVLLKAITFLSGVAVLWVFTYHPFAQPRVILKTAEARQALEHAMADKISAEWLLPRLDIALFTHDQDEAERLAGLATKYGVPLSPEIWQQIDLMRNLASEGQRGDACLTCAQDIHACETLAEIDACAIPQNTLPAEDLALLRHHANSAMSGAPVAKLEVALLLVSTSATNSAPTSGSSSLVVRAGTLVLRAGDAMGAISPVFEEHLTDSADIPIDWGAILQSGSLTSITDPTALSQIARVAADIGKIRTNTTLADTLLLLRYIDSAEEAAKLAQLSGVTQQETRATIEVLGKTPAFRAMSRISDLALIAIGLLTLFAGLLGLFVISHLKRRIRQLFSRRPVAQR